MNLVDQFILRVFSFHPYSLQEQKDKEKNKEVNSKQSQIITTKKLDIIDNYYYYYYYHYYYNIHNLKDQIQTQGILNIENSKVYLKDKQNTTSLQKHNCCQRKQLGHLSNRNKSKSKSKSKTKIVCQIRTNSLSINHSANRIRRLLISKQSDKRIANTS